MYSGYVENTFRAYFDERMSSDAESLMARAIVAVRLDQETLTATFDPDRAESSTAHIVSAAPFDNWAYFAGLPIGFTTSQSRLLRIWVRRVETRLVTGELMGSATVEEIFEHNVSRPLRPGD